MKDTDILHLKQKRKIYKGRSDTIELVASKDIMLEQVLSLEGKTLAGYFSGRKIAFNSLRVRMAEHWFQFNYCPTFHLLRKVWIVFIFNEQADAERILSTRWMWDSALLSLRRWSPLFDPATEKPTIGSCMEKMTGPAP